MIDLAYILSPGHSGSTLLGLLLGAHPQIATVGELKWAPETLRKAGPCSCGAPMNQCPFWIAVADRLRLRRVDLLSADVRAHVVHRRTFAEKLVAGQVHEPGLERVRRIALAIWPPAGLLLHELLHVNYEMMGAIQEHMDRPVFLDTSKDASRLRYLSHDKRLRVRVLHLIRDGRAVAYSLIRKGETPQEAAREWAFEHEQAERLRSSLRPAGWLAVHYEKFCEHPDAELARICAFLGVDPAQRTLDYRSWKSHVIGNRMRLGSDNVIRLDESWKTGLVGETLGVVESMTAAFNRRYGYA